MSDTQLAGFIADVGLLLKQQALTAKAERDAVSEADQRSFAQGRLFAYLEVLSLVQQELDAFGIDRAAMQLADIEPERDLL